MIFWSAHGQFLDNGANNKFAAAIVASLDGRKTDLRKSLARRGATQALGTAWANLFGYRGWGCREIWTPPRIVFAKGIGGSIFAGLLDRYVQLARFSGGIRVLLVFWDSRFLGGRQSIEQARN